ncbi:hypothetical protein LXA43DRAFT_1136728 [Ganoderma leucocontextum]|nr:hypothetical protein LXA43DRAFT_1136728 [Ganoderma leucocontextum]
MSSNDVPTISAAEALALLVSNHSANAAATLIIFESIITIGQEAKYFWSGKATGAAILFYLNKYLTLISFVYTTVGYIPLASDRTYGAYIRCAAMVQSEYVIEILAYFPWAAFSGMRAFALSRNWPVSLLIICLSLVPVAVNLLSSSWSQAVADMPRSNQVTIASRTSLILADCLLVAITWFGIDQPKRMPLQRNTFAAVLLHDGLIYFLTLLVLNSLHLALTMISQSDIPSLQDASFVALFLEPLTTILVSRFLLHLQSVKHKALNTGSTSSHHSSVVFDRVLGSLDQSLSAEDFFRADGDGEADDST